MTATDSKFFCPRCSRCIVDELPLGGRVTVPHCGVRYFLHNDDGRVRITRTSPEKKESQNPKEYGNNAE